MKVARYGTYGSAAEHCFDSECRIQNLDSGAGRTRSPGRPRPCFRDQFASYIHWDLKSVKIVNDQKIYTFVKSMLRLGRKASHLAFQTLKPALVPCRSLQSRVQPFYFIFKSIERAEAADGDDCFQVTWTLVPPPLNASQQTA